MGNAASSPDKSRRSFPGSSIVEGAGNLCGSLTNVDDDSYNQKERGQQLKNKPLHVSLWEQADAMCISSPVNNERKDSQFLDTDEDEVQQRRKQHGDDSDDATRDNDQVTNDPTSALFARALVSEVTNNPKTMTPAEMAERERRLLKAQEAARKLANNNSNNGAAGGSNHDGNDGPKPVGVPGGVGEANIMGSIANAIGVDVTTTPACTDDNSRTSSSNDNNDASSHNHRAQHDDANNDDDDDDVVANNASPHRITIGLSLSRKHANIGHPDTLTRQTAFDLNELQDRQYKYVSSIDASGWLAGGGETTGSSKMSSDASGDGPDAVVPPKNGAPDTVHIPIIHIDAESTAAVDAIISALARGEVFIPHMAVLPEALTVNGNKSPPNLVLSFGCERNDDAPPEEWPNWCLEFMHNQLYEYFLSMGARWMKRPFQTTIARKVRWKTVKHMNQFFARSERVLDTWREKGPQYLDPELSYGEGGATPEEVSRPHGIYLLRNGKPTNYFAPNFEPPYTTKMTRSLLMNVIGKSWDKKRREWTSQPVPKLVTPAALVGAMCGCAEPQGGFMANEVTNTDYPQAPHSPPSLNYQSIKEVSRQQQQQQQQQQRQHQGQRKDRQRFDGDISLPSSGEHAMILSDELLLKEEKKADDQDSGDCRDTSQPSPVSQDMVTAPPKRHTFATGNRNVHRPPEHLQSEDITGAGKSSNPIEEQSRSVVAASCTTVPHTNSSSLNIKKGPLIKRLSQVDKPVVVDQIAPQVQRETQEQESPSNENDKSKDVDSLFDDIDDDLDAGFPDQNGASALSTRNPQGSREIDPLNQEHTRQVASNAMTRENKAIKAKTSSPVNAGPGSQYFRSRNHADPKHSGGSAPAVQKSDSDSGLSLDYSLDSSLLGENSLIGQHYASDKSNVTASSTRRHKSSAATEKVTSPSSPEKSTRSKRSNKNSKASADEDDDGSFSYQTEMTEPVPSDEELFEIGWAKALDPNSGSYYYFTLDRSKTVWENPLNPDPSSPVPSTTLSETSI